MTQFMEQTKDRQHGRGLRPVQVEIGIDDLLGLPDLPARYKNVATANRREFCDWMRLPAAGLGDRSAGDRLAVYDDLDLVTVTTEPQGGDLWYATAKYELRDFAGDYEFDTSGGTQRLLDHNYPTYDFAAHLPQPIESGKFLETEREVQMMTTRYRNWECVYLNSHHAAEAEDWGRRYLRVTRKRDSIQTRHKLLNHTHSQFRGAVEILLASLFPHPSAVEK